MIAICLALVLIAIVIHPDVDIPNAHAKRGISAAMFALPVAGLKSLTAIISGGLPPDSIAILGWTTSQFNLPMLC